MAEPTIKHVSDTAIWVSYFRAVESERADALFSDPFARKLVGDRGEKIADSMRETSVYARFSVVIRTVVIDRLLRKKVSEGIDTVLNLGAGLDTRPYRLQISGLARWIEVDYPHMIEHKAAALKDEKVLMPLERVSLDLSDRKLRKKLFERIAGESKNILILTEGVLPYLTEEQVGELADDLRAHPSFKFWIGEYLAKETYRYMNSRIQRRQMKNAPFRFFPRDWFGFFKAHGWSADDIQYLPEEAAKLGRAQPAPWWANLLLPLFPSVVKTKIMRMSAYVVYSPSSLQK